MTMKPHLSWEFHGSELLEFDFGDTFESFFPLMILQIFFKGNLGKFWTLNYIANT